MTETLTKKTWTLLFSNGSHIGYFYTLPPVATFAYETRTASPLKLKKINEVLNYVENNRDSLLNSGQSLVHEFTVKVNDWEREQGRRPY